MLFLRFRQPHELIVIDGLDFHAPPEHVRASNHHTITRTHHERAVDDAPDLRFLHVPVVRMRREIDVLNQRMNRCAVLQDAMKTVINLSRVRSNLFVVKDVLSVAPKDA